jgi:polyisoprenoid-binding protein YceI
VPRQLIACRAIGPFPTSCGGEPTAADGHPVGGVTSAQGSPILRGAGIVLALALAGASNLWAAEQVLRLDPEESRVEFLLDAVLHKVKGIVRLSRGEIIFDLETGTASGEIVADAPSADTDNRKRNKKMHDEVLLSETHPEIAFYPKSITGSLEPGGESEISLTGSLVLLGEKHELLLPTHVKMDGDRLTGTASFVVPYVSWGLKDPSVFLLRVRKTVDVTLILSGTLGTPDLPTAKQDSTDLPDTATTARSSATPPRNNL